MHTNSPNILVVGGAGYIGSHMVLCLRRAGYTPVVVDNLSTGHREAVGDVELIKGDIADTEFLNNVFSRQSFRAVMHFASLIQVGESVLYPARYYHNNVSATLNLLTVMLKHGVKNFIFSSSAAVYGEPSMTLINEQHALAPINPYGRSKWMVEEMIKDFAHSDGLNYAILRYFNAAGADPEANLGECHDPETHLIPLILQVAAGQRAHIQVYGDQYPTPDGTCIRDYIHVIDICYAHLLSLQAMLRGRRELIANLGTGLGYSVFEVIQAARKITNHPIPIIMDEPRKGDPAVLIADPAYVKKTLCWDAKYSDLTTLLQHAWKFSKEKVISQAI